MSERTAGDELGDRWIALWEEMPLHARIGLAFEVLQEATDIPEERSFMLEFPTLANILRTLSAQQLYALSPQLRNSRISEVQHSEDGDDRTDTEMDDAQHSETCPTDSEVLSQTSSVVATEVPDMASPGGEAEVPNQAPSTNPNMVLTGDAVSSLLPSMEIAADPNIVLVGGEVLNQPSPMAAADDSGAAEGSDITFPSNGSY